MTNTVVSPLAHVPEEHNIAVMPGADVVEKIVTIQKLVAERLGDAAWFTPPNALHCTFMEIICNTDYEGVSRAEHFAQWREQYGQAAQNTIAQFPRLHIVFDQLVASPAAIILKASNPEPLNAMRATLLEHMVLPAQTKQPPDITHCSIARYSESVDLDDVQKRLADISVAIEMPVTELKLMKDLGPDFHPTLLETYLLAQ